MEKARSGLSKSQEPLQVSPEETGPPYSNTRYLISPSSTARQKHRHLQAVEFIAFQWAVSHDRNKKWGPSWLNTPWDHFTNKEPILKFSHVYGTDFDCALKIFRVQLLSDPHLPKSTATRAGKLLIFFFHHRNILSCFQRHEWYTTIYNFI